MPIVAVNIPVAIDTPTGMNRGRNQYQNAAIHAGMLVKHNKNITKCESLLIPRLSPTMLPPIQPTPTIKAKIGHTSRCGGKPSG